MQRSRPALVVFDLGEVLATAPGLISELAQLLGVTEEAASAAYWRSRNAYDRGSTDDDYWRAVAHEVGAAVTRDDIEALATLDAETWTELRPDAREVLADLHDSDVRVAVLSNAPRALAASIARREWSRLVERVFVTGELTVAKPDPEVFVLVAETMGVPPAEILFLDDRAENVEAARREGWDAVQWLSPVQMRSVLVERGVLAASPTRVGVADE